MKKILVVFIICFIAVFTTFIVTNYNINIDVIVENISTFTSRLSGKQPIEYSDEFKVNRLQPQKATYYYNRLNVNQKKMYSAIAVSIKDLKTVVNIDNYDYDTLEDVSEDVKVVMSAFFGDHPEVFYLNLTYKLFLSKTLLYDRIRIELSYSVEDKNDLEDKLNRIEKVIDSYINNLDNMSDFEKELHIHDNLARNIKYYDETKELSEIPEKYHNIYGAFIENVAVCDGISKAAQILLDRVGIENIFVTGMIRDVPHAWNMVRLDYKWYHLDITSNKYVKEPDGTTKTVAHTYFNVTDEFISKHHTIDNKELNPVANSTDYNYFVKTNSYIYSHQDFETRIKEIVKAQHSSNALEFATDQTDVPNKLLNILYDINFNEYKSKGKNVKMKYYNEHNKYIVQKE